MRKFTLFFISLFLLLGTAIAQESTVFELQTVNPGSDAPVSRVDYIQLMFTKNVTVTLPEEPIVITNEDSSVKYNVVNGMGYGPNAILYIKKVGESNETKGSDNKDTKGDKDEQEVVTAITTVGTYTYTIPAGVIKSEDGDVFGEHTFSFTVSEPFTFNCVYPGQNSVDKIEYIQLAFSKEVDKVEIPKSGMMLVDEYWTTVANIKKDVVISEDKKLVTLELDNPVTASGRYYLDIYNGVFTSSDGMKNEYTTISFSISDTKPSFSTNINNGDKVQKLNDLVITFKNVNEVKLIETDNVVAYIPGGGESSGTAALANNVITVKFDQEFTEDGDYTFVIPEGTFTMDGTPNEECQINVVLYTFEFIPLEIVSVTPVEGSVQSLEKIIIKYNQIVTLSYNEETWQLISGNISLMCGRDKYTLTYNSSSNASDEIEYLVNAKWTGYEYETTPITASGKYTIDLAEIVVDYAPEDYVDEYGYPNKKWHKKGGFCTGVVAWTIGETAIEDVDVDAAEQNIYDLTGRRVNSITNAGIYIVNGKKVIVK